MPRKKMELDRLSLSLNTDRATPGRHREKICRAKAKARMGSVLQNARFIHYVWDRPPPRKKEGLGIESIPRLGDLDERCRVKLFLCCSDRFLCQTLTSCLTTKCSGTLEYHKERDTSYPGISRESFLVRHLFKVTPCLEKEETKIMLIAVEDGVRNEPHGAILLPSPANQAAQQAK